MLDCEDIPALCASIDVEQLRLRRLLLDNSGAAWAERPPNGQWSVLENLRHLLFAEQAHLGRFVPDGQRWSPLGFTPATMRAARKLPPVETALPSLFDVLAEWEALHVRIGETISGLRDEDVRRALIKNRKHLRAHARVIERLLPPR
jgi:hypothetical protein